VRRGRIQGHCWLLMQDPGKRAERGDGDAGENQ
jgi:hypothetical protein